MMTSQDRNPIFRTVTARMRWICDDPADLEACGPRLRESRTFAQAQRAVARQWPARNRYGFKAMGWAGPISTDKLDLFETAPA